MLRQDEAGGTRRQPVREPGDGRAGGGRPRPGRAPGARGDPLHPGAPPRRRARPRGAAGRSREGRRPGDLAFARVVAGTLLRRRGRLDPALEVRGLGRAAFAIVANVDPYTYVGSRPLHAAPLAELEKGLDVVAPVRLRPVTIARIVGHLLRGRGLERARGVLYAHDLDRVEIVCDRPLPVQVDGEDLGDVDRLECVCERGAVSVLV